MKTATCRCGARWVQSGNRVGHCAACHVTISGIGAFDRHQTLRDGKNVCRHPSTITRKDGVSLAFESFLDRVGTQVWRVRDTPHTEGLAA